MGRMRRATPKPGFTYEFEFFGKNWKRTITYQCGTYRWSVESLVLHFTAIPYYWPHPDDPTYDDSAL